MKHRGEWVQYPELKPVPIAVHAASQSDSSTANPDAHPAEYVGDWL